MADIAVDLGNYNTLITFREGDTRYRGLLRGVARQVREVPGTLFVPSLVHFGRQVLLGEEVLHAGVYGDDATFRDLKDHILHPTPVARKVGDRRITHKEAAAAFLRGVLERLAGELDEGIHAVLLFPSADGESFREWLRGADLGPVQSVTLVDEDTALALGYGLNLFTDDLVLVFDFGFSAVRLRVVQFHWMGREGYAPPVVKASVSVPVGTADLKQKILRELHADDVGKPLPSFYWKKFVLHEADAHTWRREEFRRILERENLAAQVQRAIDRVLEEARLGGVDPGQIRKVLLLGGGTRIPVVRRVLDENFGDRVLGHEPELAPGRGALLFLSDSPVDDMVRETYSLQVRDPITGQYHYPVVVERFTRYPTRNPTARYIVNTFYDGQYELHLRVYRSAGGGPRAEAREILYGDDGRISFVASQEDETHEPAMDAPLVIPVHPPGRVGERRFLLEFKVDARKRLTVTVKDLREEKVIWEDRPLIELR
ncbi:MAG: hypothetical protein D6708_12250 [Candidatus Dadabacteria bacterium]|nr:MAG: hypothetical protein D6708_12250 [Candidatus Dadabacteria bacterium]